MLHSKAMLARAQALNDPYTQLYALNSLIVSDTTGANSYSDSLATLYAKLNLTTQALAVADKVLMKQPDNTAMLELKASALMALGRDDEGSKMIDSLAKKYPDNAKMNELQASALVKAGKTGDAANLFRKQYQQDSNPSTLVKLAYIQAETGNLKGAEATLKEIEAHPKYKSETAEFQTADPSKMQQVPLPAAVAYFRGYLAIKKNDPQTALNLWDKALGLYPEFYMAKSNIAYVKNAMRGGQ